MFTMVQIRRGQIPHSRHRQSARCYTQVQLDLPRVSTFVHLSLKPWLTHEYRRLVTIFREEGPAALYKGFVPKVLRLAPGGGVLLLVVEFTLGVFRQGALGCDVRETQISDYILFRSVGATLYLILGYRHGTVLLPRNVSTLLKFKFHYFCCIHVSAMTSFAFAYCVMLEGCI